MANVSLKKDFVDGEKLFAVQLNNNFGAIEAALDTMNKIVWQDDDADSVMTYRGTAEEIEAREIINGQLLYNIETGETFIDYEGERISTGSGNVVYVGENEPTNNATKLWIQTGELLQTLKYRDPETGVFEVIKVISSDTLPIGSIIPYGNATAPTNWLICDGSAVSRTTYADLFEVIGTSYGEGDGSTTFNLPNLKGRVPVGKDSTQTEFDTLGETGGEKTHTLTLSEIPEHIGHLSKNDAQPSGGTASGKYLVGTSMATSGTAARGWNDLGNEYYPAGVSRGGNQSHNNLQPYQVVNYIIKANQSIGVVGNVLNEESSSTKDTYSCKYVNDMITPNEINKDIVIEDTNVALKDLASFSSDSYSNTSMKAGSIRFYKYGRVVYFICEGDALNIPNGVNVYINNIDDKYVPICPYRGKAYNDNSFKYTYIEISDNQVRIGNYTGSAITTSQNMAFMGCYISNE